MKLILLREFWLKDIKVKIYRGCPHRVLRMLLIVQGEEYIYGDLIMGHKNWWREAVHSVREGKKALYKSQSMKWGSV